MPYLKRDVFDAARSEDGVGAQQLLAAAYRDENRSVDRFAVQRMLVRHGGMSETMSGRVRGVPLHRQENLIPTAALEMHAAVVAANARKCVVLTVQRQLRHRV